DMATLPLRARLAKQLLHLMRRFGPRTPQPAGEMPVGISLVQDEMAQLLGCSRQRVNVELKAMERDGVIRMAQRGITILDLAQLEALAQQENQA
ncbi:MAG: winged helix-turn-helix domain-containing protein, partial [Burkholderiaceae bacterium]|nr:winged helix-turn-helix domain-containing protein [Burkholderiaceae bacterium]